MSLPPSSYQRIKSLKLNLEEINRAYADLMRDYILDSGLQYDKDYPDNEDTHKLFKKAEDLYIVRKDKLFTAILNFTQTFYSLKEHLKRELPVKTALIEDFFSNETENSLSRKSISNSLKHNPEEDLKFDSRVVKREIIKESGKETHISFLKYSWFYGEKETVEYCQQLYLELLDFLRKTLK